MFLAYERAVVPFHLTGVLVGIMLDLTQPSKEGASLGLSLP